ncbi:hypothetical protein L3i23_02850 [Herbiconiux sp. L3-i23]|nr:hypothetical protein L3i23_02850 [Herbiconiux sp. L3-i23]
MVAIVTVVAVLTGVVGAPGVQQSLAAWNDAEFVRASLRTLDCTSPSIFRSTANARLVSGTAFAAAPDDAAANSVTATAVGAGTTVDRSNAVAVGGGYRSVVDTAALAANATYSIPTTVALPTTTPTPAGWVSATGNGRQGATSGILTASGAVDSAGVASAPSRWTSVHLASIVAQATGAPLSTAAPGITALELRTGGFASAASIDACAARWTATTNSLLRSYQVGAMRYELASPSVQSLVDTARTARTSLVNSVQGIANNTTLSSNISSGVTALLAGLLGLLGLGTASSTVSATLATSELAALDALLVGTASDSTGLVTIDFATGTVSIDAAKLQGALNGRDPNSPLVFTPAQSAAVATAISGAVATWSASVVAALQRAAGAVRVSSTTVIDLTATVLGAQLTVARIEAKVIDTPIASMAASQATVTTTVLPAAGLLTGVVSALVGGLVSGLVSGVGTVVAQLVAALLAPTYNTVVPQAATIATTLGTQVGGAMTTVFGPSGIALLSLNAQNQPKTGTNPVPASLAALPAGRYDVGAVRVEIRPRTGAVSSAVGRWLMLGSSSVGPATLLN